MGCGFKTLMWGWGKLYHSLFLLPNPEGRGRLADVRALAIETGDEDFPEAQNGEHERELMRMDSQDPFDVAENSERSIPSHCQDQGVADPDDPFKDVILFQVLLIIFLKDNKGENRVE